ncbi:MAG: 6,7-dimethyl-8-ribityllumazine synthase [Polaribacter sp.]|jgi:6,7-dimethyl-8-ribityllumazine synthase
MASSLKNLSQYDEKNIPSVKDYKFGIVVSDWNSEITHDLYKGCLDTLLKHGATEDNIEVAQVPGTFELPTAARLLAKRHDPHAIICIGCVITGETKHNEYINNAVAQGLVNLSIASGKPFIFGVLTPDDEQQAKDRAGGKYGNKGVEAAVTAIRMAVLKKEMETSKSTIGF